MSSASTLSESSRKLIVCFSILLYITTYYYIMRCKTFSAQSFLQHLIHQLRLRLSLGGLHHLPYKEADDRRLARTVLLHLLRICGDHLVNDLLDRQSVSDLLGFFPLIDRGKIFSAGEGLVIKVFED